VRTKIDSKVGFYFTESYFSLTRVPLLHRRESSLYYSSRALQYGHYHRYRNSFVSGCQVLNNTIEVQILIIGIFIVRLYR